MLMGGDYELSCCRKMRLKNFDPRWAGNRGPLQSLARLTSISLALYLIPQTAVLGAIMLTGYLGGRVATHLRVGETGKSLGAGRVWRCGLAGACTCVTARLRSLIPIRKL